MSSSTYFLRAFPMKGRAYIEAEGVIVVKNALVVVRDEHDVIWGGSPGAFNHMVSRIVEVIDLVIPRRRRGTGRGKTYLITLPRAAVVLI